MAFLSSIQDALNKGLDQAKVSVSDGLSQARVGVSDILEKRQLSIAKKEQELVADARALGPNQKYVDLTIQFIGASDLPQMDIAGKADPYFRASLDGKLQYISTVKENTLAPVWNELWHVKNVPTTARLDVTVLDKDPGPRDDVIGRFHALIEPGAKEQEIEGVISKRNKGTFWLKVEWRDPAHAIEACPPYTFDGPVHFSKHYSPTVGFLTQLNDERLYSTWKVYIKGVPMFFGDTVQGWNRDYPAAQRIFGPGPESIALRSAIRSAHSVLYARTTRNAFGVIETNDDVLSLFRGTTRGESQLDQGQKSSTDPSPGDDFIAPEAPRPSSKPALRIKPAIYTYAIAVQDSSFRFSETGAAFLVDFASKHALHANCAEAVRYSGEFHLRPLVDGGWEGFHDAIPDDQVGWELVIDNNSGTYAPNKDDLWRVRETMEYNLPGIQVRALDRDEPELKASVKACREYALKYRGVQKGELEPHLQQQQGSGEKTMQQMIADGDLRPPTRDDPAEGAGSIVGFK